MLFSCFVDLTSRHRTTFNIYKEFIQTKMMWVVIWHSKLQGSKEDSGIPLWYLGRVSFPVACIPEGVID